jgi:hypothetical protein
MGLLTKFLSILLYYPNFFSAEIKVLAILELKFFITLVDL